MRSRSTPWAVLCALLIVALQAFDVWSTLHGLSRGAVEANPLMAPFVSDASTLIAIKATLTAFLLAATWKRPAAAGLIIAFYVYVGVNNWQVISQLS